MLVLAGIALASIGLAVGVVWPHLLTRVLVTAEVEGHDADLASSAISTVQLVATALGAALAGALANAAGLGTPGRTGRAATALFAAFAVAPALAFPGLRGKDPPAVTPGPPHRSTVRRTQECSPR